MDFGVEGNSTQPVDPGGLPAQVVDVLHRGAFHSNKSQF